MNLDCAVCFYDFFHDACFVKPDFDDSRFILKAINTMSPDEGLSGAEVQELLTCHISSWIDG